MVAHPWPVANCCVLAVPSADDVGRLYETLQRIADIACGEVAPEPHVTLAYYYNVTAVQLAPLGDAVADLALQAAPLVMQARRLIRDPGFSPAYDPYALFFEIDKTPPMAVVYAWLRRLGTQQGLEVSPAGAQAWVPHFKVVSAPAPVAEATKDQIDRLAMAVHFTTTHLVLSFRGDTDDWKNVGAYPLAD